MGLRAGHHELAHLSVQARERAQLVHPVRVRQETRIEDHIGFRGNAELEPEGDEGDQQLVAELPGEEGLLYPVSEFVDVQPGCVDHHVGTLAQRSEQAALLLDPRQQRPAVNQRVGPASRLVPSHQRLVGRLQEEYAQPRAQGGDAIENLPQLAEVLGPTHVDDHGQTIHPAPLEREKIHHAGQHLRGQVVDAEETHVLEGGNGLRLARA